MFAVLSLSRVVRRLPAGAGPAAVTIVLGTPTLRAAITSRHGSRGFLYRTAALQAIWAAGAAWTHAAASAPRPAPEAGARRLHMEGSGRVAPHGSPRGSRAASVRRSLATAGLMSLAFTAGGLVAARCPGIRRLITTVVDHEREGNSVAVVVAALSTGISEELFFRGGLYEALQGAGLDAPVVSTGIYTTVTLATGNPLLTATAAVVGTLCARERSRSGSVLGPALIHTLWSATMILVLPRIAHDDAGAGRGAADRPLPRDVSPGSGRGSIPR